MKESVFFNVLVSVVGDYGVVLVKVNMINVIILSKVVNKKYWFIVYNKILKSYFDFVVCDVRMFEFRVVFELDDGKEL